MIQLPSDITQRDIQQWTNDGVVLLDRTTPAVIAGVGSRDIAVRLVESGDQIVLGAGERGRIYAAWPRCGSLNVDGTAIYLQRRQVQMYRRTYNARCLSIVFPNKWALLKRNSELVARYSSPLKSAVILAAFNAEYPEWEEAQAMLESQPLVAINPYIILGDDGAVYYRARKCGIIADETFTPLGKGLPAARAFKLLQGRVNLC